MRKRLLPLLGCFVMSASTVLCAQTAQQPNYGGNPGGLRIIEEGQPPVMIHPTVEAMKAARGEHQQANTANDLSYHGGTSDGSAGTVGVETAPKVYVVFWGTGWSNDPSGEACVLTGATSNCPAGTSSNFLGNVGGSSWNNTVTQYCEGVSSGTVTCSGGTPVGN